MRWILNYPEYIDSGDLIVNDTATINSETDSLKSRWGIDMMKNSPRLRSSVYAIIV